AQQALAAISGLGQARLRGPLGAAGWHIAIETGADACIAGGPAAALESLAAGVAAAGGRLGRLPVDVAAHTPYMREAVAPFAAALRASAYRTPRAPLLSGIGACKIDSKAAAVEHLSRQLAEKIVWMDCMDACAEAGVTVALELGPGAALSRMLLARHPGIDCRAAADFRSLDGIARWLGRHFD
uniref:ACP S-malonyltransferase n=1 Tax=Janthinobacterium sp. TaxID=1871054 RepID=UPI003977410B